MLGTEKVLGRLRASILKMSCLNGNGTLDKVETILRSSCAVMVCLALIGLLAAQTAWAEWMEQDKIAASDAAQGQLWQFRFDKWRLRPCRSLYR
jgi:Zn-dependent protease with chaperone function